MKKLYSYFIWLFLANWLLPTANSFSQGTWVQKANFGGAGRFEGYAFSLGNKGYVGGGGNNSVFFLDFWEWDQTTDTWSQKANFPTRRLDPAAFAIGAKGYVVSGVDPANPNLVMNDVWEWNQATNIWTQKANFPGI